MMNEEKDDLERFAPGLVLFLALVGGFMRVLLLGAKGMWLDETFSVWMASHDVADMLHWIVQIDQHPPLYYLLLHGWMAWTSQSPYDVRMLSVLFGVGTIPLVYLIGRRFSGAVVGLAAATFMSLSLYNIYFAQEARMYTLLTFNAAAAIYALVRLLTDPRSVRPIGSQFREALHIWRTAGPVVKEEFSYRDASRDQTGWRGWFFRHRWPSLQSVETDLAWVAFVVFSAAILLTHNTAVFFVVAANLFVLCLMLQQRLDGSGAQRAFQVPSLGNWVKAQVGIFLLWSPWLVPFLRQVSRVDREFWLPKPTWETIIQTFRALLNPSAPTQTGQIITWGLCAVLVLGLVYYRKQLSKFWFLAALFFIPVLGELLVSLRRPIFYDRTLIWITIPMFLLLASGIAQLRFRFFMFVGLGLIATSYLFATGDYYRFYQKEDWMTPAGYVANFAEKDDLILFNSNFVEIAFDYYFEPYKQQYSLQVTEQGVPLDLIEDGMLEPKMTEGDVPGLVSMLRGHDRVWLVYSHDSYTDPDGIVPRTLASQMRLTREREFYGGRVQLYEAP